MSWVAKLAGKAVAHRARRSGWLDVRRGFNLMRDGRIPLGTKLACLAAGVLLTAMFEALELPMEAVLAAVIPFLGFGIDLAFDGIEFLVLPLVIASLLLSRFARDPAPAPRYIPTSIPPRTI